MFERTFRSRALPLCCMLLTAALATRYVNSQTTTPLAADEIDQLVIAAVPQQREAKPKIIAHIDLTQSFGTTSQWTFVAVQAEGDPTSDLDEGGPISLCLVKGREADCTLHMYQGSSDDSAWMTPHHLFVHRVVFADENKSRALLLLKVCGPMGVNGDCAVATALYRYDKRGDSFRNVFLSRTGRNNNQETRFVESGPLQGDIIVNRPTQNAPYTYWIEVYRAAGSGEYAQILRYRSRTAYGDGNPLAVADSEMPEILRRLGLWKPGDPLPIPPHLPRGCRRVYLKGGEEWCK